MSAAGRGAGDLTGLEELRSFTFGWQDRKSTVAVGDLLQRTVPLVTVGADWGGKVNAGPVLAVDQHAFELRFGRLVLWVLDNVLLEQGAASLSQTAASLVNCAAITSALLDGKSEFSFGARCCPTRSAPAPCRTAVRRPPAWQGQGTGPVRHGRRGRAGGRGRGAGRRRRPHRRPPEEQGRLWRDRDQVGAGGAGAAGDRPLRGPAARAPRTPGGSVRTTPT